MRDILGDNYIPTMEELEKWKTQGGALTKSQELK